MPNNEMDPCPGRERIIILALCFIAACRIFLFSAALPFFTNLDEQLHLDVVYRYSQGDLPRAGLENLSREVAELIVLYGTCEYLSTLEEFPSGSIPPPGWTYPNVRKSVWFAKLVSEGQQHEHPQTGSFPVYYIVAGLWFNVGRLLGMEGGRLLYWIRFLNVPFFAGLVWFSYLLARRFFPNTSLQRIGLPLIVAFFPQDVFYCINSDSISPLLFAISFFLLLQVYFENKSHYYHLLAGLAVAVTFLTKVSNVAVLVLLGVIVVFKVKQLLYEKKLKEQLPRLATLLAAATTPVVIWLARNYIMLGDITGSAKKIEYLGWTLKPLGQLWNHPICTPRGLLYFLTTLTKTFWRGELVWHAEPIASRSADLFYVLSTAVFILVSGLGLVLSRGKADKRHRFVLGISFGVVVVSVLFLAVLSMLFDFHNCWYPSRKLPYLVSGRLISGVLLPFLLIYVDGLALTFSRLRKYVNPLVIVALIAIVITCCKLLLTWEVFASPYNWFHLK